MNEIQKLLLAALVKISAGENDEAHDAVQEALAMLPTHVVHYCHRHGNEVYPVRYNGDGFPSEEEIIDALDLNFEVGESLTVDSLSLIQVIDGKAVES